MTLEEIKAMNNKGCVDDPSVIEGIIERFLNLKASDLAKVFGGDNEFVMNEDLLLYYDFSPEKIKTLSVGEIIFLVEATHCVESRIFTPTPEFEEREFRLLIQSILMKALDGGQKTIPEVKALFDIKLEAFFDYGKKIVPGTKWKVFKGIVEACDREIRDSSISDCELFITPNVTLGRIANVTHSIKEKSWSSFTDIFSYQSRIRAADRIDEIIFFKAMNEFAKKRWKYSDIAERMDAYEFDEDDFYGIFEMKVR